MQNRCEADASAAALDRNEGALRGADVELARAADLLLGVFDHFLPLGDPADGAGDREQRREHRRREAHRLQRDARIEIDVRVQLLLDEVVVLQRDALKFHRDLQDLLILDAERIENLVAGLRHHLGARVVVLVDAVAEAHQTELGVLVLGLLHVLGHAVDGADLLEHLERGLVGAAVGGTPEAGDAGGDAGERVGARRADAAHRRRRGVLLVVGVEDEDAVERARHDRVHDVGLAGHGEAHLQEVRRVIEVVARIDEGLADRVLVGHRGDGRHLGHEAVTRDHALLRIVDVGAVVIEGRQRADRAAHDGHGMRVTAEAGEEPRHLLVHHGVARDGVAEALELALRRQLAVEQQVADLDEVGLQGEVVDVVAPVHQLALVTVDVGDAGGAVGGRGEAGVVGEAARVAVEATDIDHVWADGARSDRHLRLAAAADVEGCDLVGIGIFRIHGARPLKRQHSSETCDGRACHPSRQLTAGACVLYISRCGKR